MAQISIVIGLGFEPPVAPNDYIVGKCKVRVSYPERVICPFRTIELTPGSSSVFEVFIDDDGRSASYLGSGTYLANEPIHLALHFINQLLSAFAFIRVGHIESGHIKTVGIADTLFYYPVVDGKIAGLNTRGKRSIYRDGQIDPCNTTRLALPYISSTEQPLARRFVRCFELEERGFFQEAIIVAFSILDDTVQDMIYELLASKGLTAEKSQKELMRSIKEARLRVYLGPLLKILCGKDVNDMWPSALEALFWLNGMRNRIAHEGGAGDRDSACKAIFVSIHLLRAFHHFGLLQHEMPPHLYRNARINASWTKNPPSWVPLEKEVDIDPFTGAALISVLQ